MKKILILWLLLISTTGFADPKPWITYSSKTLTQGDTLKISLKCLHTQPCTILFQDKTYPLFQTDPPNPDYQIYLGISRTLSPGNYKVTINNTIPMTLTIKDGKFPYSHITLLGEKKTLADDESELTEEVTLIKEKCDIITPKKLFSSQFIVPTDGRVTTKFGAYRIYNQKKESHRHAGIDLANKEGTLIVATNSGKVILSKQLKSHGNTILIDHGWGIISIYNHLNSRSVKEGDLVKINQPIGTMGTTGISTGSHLHWGLSVLGTRVNPAYWLSELKLYN